MAHAEGIQARARQLRDRLKRDPLIEEDLYEGASREIARISLDSALCHIDGALETLTRLQKSIQRRETYVQPIPDK